MAENKKASNDAVLDDLRKKHGEVAHCEMPNGRLIAFRRPTLEEYEDYQEALSTKSRGVAFRQLAYCTRLLPDESELMTIFERWPGINARIGDTLAEMAGAGIEFTVKKG
jgi:hypothetical protein